MGNELRDLWSLDGECDFLNHGSFGACPKGLLQEQAELRAEMERQPVAFLSRRAVAALDEGREQIGEFLGADPEGIAYVPNATTGVNTVLRSLTLDAGDELLVTNHEYNACRNALDFVAERHRARVVVVSLPFPLGSEDEVVDRILAHVTPRTRLALVDHVTSPTGLVLPVARVVAALRTHDVDVLVDGAHALGMLDLDLRAIGAAYYTGNCHKWMCTPKGSALLYVREDKRARIRPLVISHGANMDPHGTSRFRLEFDWTGTEDPTAYMMIPRAIRFFSELLPGGWSAIRQSNRDLALRARDLLCRALDIPAPAPDNMIASLAAVPLPDSPYPSETNAFFSDPLHEILVASHGIEVPVVYWPGRPKRLLRVSAQLYNDISQYERLSEALIDELTKELVANRDGSPLPGR